MIKILVVDDEKYDRDAIIEMLNEGFKEQLEIEEARNGKEAIEIAERMRPDIAIMDIKMPGINGLKAIQEIRKFLPNTYFIVLTAYDYFDFAVEAVKNNVKEYILKPFGKADIVEKIELAIMHVNAEKKKRKLDIENEEKLSNMMPVIENELSFAIINNSLSVIDYETYLGYLDMNFRNGFALVINVLGDQGSRGMDYEFEMLRLQIGECIKRYIGKLHKNVASFRFTREFVSFIQIKEYENEEMIRRNAIGLGSELRNEIRRLYNLDSAIGLGNCYQGITMMNKSYEEARIALSYFNENTKVVNYCDIESKLKASELHTEAANGGDKEKVALFKSVEQYIKDNLEKELDLETVAAKFNLSIYYFSRIFKDILGYNFPDYINLLRVKKAKELLLKNEISIKEICYATGYSDPNYFSKVFKKYEGMTPSEYKVKNCG
ncbi:MAG TPA: response regulator [Clostridia bacterium]|nr:response regulator [Clostridia bacterium]